MPVRRFGVALPIPEPYGSELQGWRAGFGDPLAAKIPTHITLLPPTEVTDVLVPLVEAHLLRVAASLAPFRVHLSGAASFRPLSPVVFIALAEGMGHCEVLAAAVRSGVLAQELSFPYHPHVTVAHFLPDDVLDRAFAGLRDFSCVFDATGFALYEHGADGVWRPQRDFVLGGPLPGPATEDQAAELGT